MADPTRATLWRSAGLADRGHPAGVGIDSKQPTELAADPHRRPVNVDVPQHAAGDSGRGHDPIAAGVDPLEPAVVLVAALAAGDPDRPRAGGDPTGATPDGDAGDHPVGGRVDT
jgi:hypothetical protein